MAKFNKYRRRVKYRKIEFKFTEQQFELLNQYCDINQTSIVKGAKKIIINYLESDENIILEPKTIKQNTNKPKAISETVSKKQLNLFDLIEAERTFKDS